MTEDRRTGMLVGLAIGDTLGMPLEFGQRGSFTPLESLGEGGPFDLPLGYWTDDTSMALCLADSILATGGYDSYDVMDRYARWRDEGYRSSTGVCFDIGTQVSAAIDSYKRQPVVSHTEQRTTSAGNGCIMRLAPVVLASLAARHDLHTTMRLSSFSARETHFSTLAEEATAVFSGMLFNAVHALNKDAITSLEGHGQVNPALAKKIQQAKNMTVESLRPTGYVVDTLEVAAWAFMTTDNFRDGALKAVNLGGDSDTIGAVYGQLAGAYYGLDGIPGDWRSKLFQYDIMVNLAHKLDELKAFEVIRTRFEEDVKEDTMPSDDQPHEPLTEQEKSALQNWSMIGSPGPAPSVPFKPTEVQRQAFKPIHTPRIIKVNWQFDQAVYDALQLGHLAQEMEDKWTIYTDEDVIHFHRSWTGVELFRFSLRNDGKASYSVDQFTVEQDAERFIVTDEKSIKAMLVGVMRAVLGVTLSDD